MTDIVHLAVGSPPWSPSVDSESVCVLDEYNIPLAGVIQQQGHSYFYVCAAGEEEESNVWLYSLIEDDELAELRAVVGGAFVRAMSDFLKNRTVTAALADRWEVVMWETFDSRDEQPGVLVRRFLKLLEARVRRYNNNIERLERDPSIDDSAELALSL